MKHQKDKTCRYRMFPTCMSCRRVMMLMLDNLCMLWMDMNSPSNCWHRCWKSAEIFFTHGHGCVTCPTSLLVIFLTVVTSPLWCWCGTWLICCHDFSHCLHFVFVQVDLPPPLLCYPTTLSVVFGLPALVPSHHHPLPHNSHSTVSFYIVVHFTVHLPI